MKKILIILLLFVGIDSLSGFNGEFYIQFLQYDGTTFNVSATTNEYAWNWNGSSVFLLNSFYSHQATDRITYVFDSPKSIDVGDYYLPWGLIEFNITTSNGKSRIFTIDFRDENWGAENIYGAPDTHLVIDHINDRFYLSEKANLSGYTIQIFNNSSITIWDFWRVETGVYKENFKVPVKLMNRLIEGPSTDFGTLWSNNHSVNSGQSEPFKYFDLTRTVEHETIEEFYNNQRFYSFKWENSGNIDFNLNQNLFNGEVDFDIPVSTQNKSITRMFKPVYPLTIKTNLPEASGISTGNVWFKNPTTTNQFEQKLVAGDGYILTEAFAELSEDIGDLQDQKYSVKAITPIEYNGINYGWYGGDFNPDTQTDLYLTGPLTVSANYKGNLISNQTDALTGSSQRKIIRDGSGIYHAVYTSMDKLWYTKSLTTDFNGNWSQEQKILISGHEEDNYAHPSIDIYGNILAIVFEAYDPSSDGAVYLLEMNLTNGNITMVDSEPIDISRRGNSNPVVAYDQYHRIYIYDKSSTDGLSYKRNYFLSGSSWSGWQNEQPVPNTTSSSKNPSIAGQKPVGSDFHLVWQEGNSSIKYVYIKKKTDNQLWFQSYNTISSGSSYSNNQFPSISLTSNYSDPIVSWRGGRKEKVVGKISNKIEGLVWVYRTVTLPSTQPDTIITWGNFYITGSDVGFTNNNSTSSSSPETVIAWSENNGTASKWLRRTGTTYSAVEDLSHNGNQIQISNSSTLSKMKGLVLSEGNLPYILQRTTTAFQGLGKISGTNGPTFSRTGVVYKNGLEFVFNIGDILLNGENVLFVERADTLPVTGITELNEALNTNTFSLNSNSELLFSNYYYVVNPELADSLLTEDDEVTFMVQLVNADNNQVTGTFDQVTYNRTNVGDYDNINYTVDCSGIEDGNYYFRLVTSVEGNSSFYLSNVQNDAENLGKKKYTNINYDGDFGPKTYSLSQNYPNPFNPSTTIKYQIPVNGNVMLKIYDILGREVTTLVDEFKTEGRYEVNFNASSLASGVYLYRISVNDPSIRSGQNYVDVKKMILLR